MGKTLKQTYLSQIVQLLLIVSIAGAVLLPPIRIKASIPALEISDVTFPILCILSLLFFRTPLIQKIKEHKTLIIGLALFITLAILSIFWNSRSSNVRDWFEVAKYIKFTTFIILTYFFFSHKQLMQIITPLFIGVFLFNIFHYFNLFNFNHIIEPFYAPAHHLDIFGVNSIGEPSTKRALGTLGNPNNNAILFLVFFVLFLPRNKNLNYFHFTLMILAIFGLFLCQSRTGFVSFIIITLVYFLTCWINWKIAGSIIVLSALFYFVFSYYGNVYLDSIASPTSMINATDGRLTQWNKILVSMKNNTSLGHAPNKEYFEANNIYSESEYALILFRYGILGLSAFILFWFLWFKQYALPYKKTFNLGLYTLLAYVISALTNNPLQSPKIALILAVMMALTLLEIDEQKKES